MALIRCAECNAEISDKAKTCPQCGAPSRERRYRKWGYIFAAPPAILAVMAIGYGISVKADGPEGQAMSNTVERLRTHLKDPDSMVIRSSHTIVKPRPGSENQDIFICGFVDGKNAFGAYAGALRFVSRSVYWPGTLDTISVVVEDQDETTQARSVDMRSAFEKVYWDPHCPSSA